MMDDLILRLERTAGPDRQLDVEIVYALHPDIGAYQPHCVGEEPIFWHEPYRKKRCPKFTESVDAAITLVPRGHGGWELGTTASGLHCATIWNADSTCPQDRYQIEGATPAIALCLAALKARTSVLTSAQSGGAASTAETGSRAQAQAQAPSQSHEPQPK